MTRQTGCSADGGATPALWLVRHGRPLIPAGVCYGSTDVAADPQHTAELAATLAEVLPRSAALLTSPLQRCAVLAHALCARRPDLVLRIEPGITEYDFGCWEGWRWDAIPQPAYAAWTSQFARHRFGGVDCVQDLMDRVGRVWAEHRAAAMVQVWITHAGVMSAAGLLASGVSVLDSADAWPRSSPAFGALHLLGGNDAPAATGP